MKIDRAAQRIPENRLGFLPRHPANAKPNRVHDQKYWYKSAHCYSSLEMLIPELCGW